MMKCPIVLQSGICDGEEQCICGGNRKAIRPADLIAPLAYNLLVCASYGKDPCVNCKASARGKRRFARNSNVLVRSAKSESIAHSAAHKTHAVLRNTTVLTLSCKIERIAITRPPGNHVTSGNTMVGWVD